MTIPYGKTTSPSEVRRRAEERAHEEAQRLQEAADRTAQNEELRAAYRAKLLDKRREELARQAAATEAELAPEKTRLQRRWLVDHPDHTAADFESRAWPLLRQNLVEGGAATSFEEALAASLASGRYSRL